MGSSVTSTNPYPVGTDPKLARALDRLATTEHGKPQVDWLIAHNMPIVVLPDRVRECMSPGSGAHAHKGKMYLSASTLNNVDRSAEQIAHETQHLKDRNLLTTVRDAYGWVPYLLLDAVQGALNGENPFSAAVDRAAARSHFTEVRAYEVGAKVGRELGHDKSRWSGLGQMDDGSLASPSTIMDRLEEHSLYKPRMLERIVMGGVTMGLMAGVLLGVRNLGLKAIVKNPAAREPIMTWSRRTILAGTGALWAADSIGWYRHMHPKKQQGIVNQPPPVQPKGKSQKECEKEAGK